MKEDIESQKTRVTLKSHEFFVTYINSFLLSI